MGNGRLLAATVILIYCFLLAPLVAVLAVSFTSSSILTITWLQPSTQWYAEFFRHHAFFDSLFQVSLPLAISAGTVATLLGALASIALVRYRFRGRSTIGVVLMLPIFIPTILLGAALYIFFGRLDMSATFFTMLLGHILIGIPYVIRVVSAGLSGLDPSLEEAAVSLGCSRIGAFIKVVLPVIRGSLISGWMFAFIISFSDINLALFLAGPDTQTMPLQIFSEIQWGADPTIAAASGVQIILIGSLLLIMQKIFRVRFSFS